jgi:hypothetical protein
MTDTRTVYINTDTLIRQLDVADRDQQAGHRTGHNTVSIQEGSLETAETCVSFDLTRSDEPQEG